MLLSSPSFKKATHCENGSVANCFKAYLSAFVAPPCLAFSEAVKTSGEDGLLLEEDFDEVDVEARGRVALPSLLAMSWQSLSTVTE